MSVHDADKKWVEEFETAIRHLAGLVEEMFHENKVLLLSQICREIIRNKGREVKKLLDKASNRIIIDNPCKEDLYGKTHES